MLIQTDIDVFLVDTIEALGGARRNEQICDLKTKGVRKQQDVWSK
jgi:hypothetical protein